MKKVQGEKLVKEEKEVLDEKNNKEKVQSSKNKKIAETPNKQVKKEEKK